jgi:hypothetical protein
MPRKPNKPGKNEKARVHVLLSGNVILQLDHRAAQLAAAEPGSTVTRTEVVRRAIYHFLERKDL